MSNHKQEILKPYTEDQRCEFIIKWNHTLGLDISEDENGIYADDHVANYTIADYDNALEEHLLAERNERGYTTREPSLYANSSNARWKQDAEDWIAHVDAVMSYGLDIENKYKNGESVPSLDEFRNAIPKIEWTIKE